VGASITQNALWLSVLFAGRDPAAAQQAEDAEPARQRGPGRKSAFLYRWERGPRGAWATAKVRPGGFAFIGHRRIMPLKSGLPTYQPER